MPQTNRKRSAPRKIRPSKLTYKELLLSRLTAIEWIEEDALLTSIVCKKYGITRAKSSRKKSVLSNLHAGLEKGEFRRALEGDRVFWRLGDGTPAKDISLSSNSGSQTVDYDGVARESAVKLESFLLGLCTDKLNGINFGIPKVAEHELLKRMKRETGVEVYEKKSDLLKFASINDFSWIITENWALFISFKNKNDFISKTKELNGYRRRLIHPSLGPLTDEEKQYFSLSVLIFMEGSSIK